MILLFPKQISKNLNLRVIGNVNHITEKMIQAYKTGMSSTLKVKMHDGTLVDIRMETDSEGKWFLYMNRSDFRNYLKYIYESESYDESIYTLKKDMTLEEFMDLESLTIIGTTLSIDPSEKLRDVMFSTDFNSED